MFDLAIFIGIYSYLIFFLGVFGVLYKQVVIDSSVIYFILCGLYFFFSRRTIQYKVRFSWSWFTLSCIFLLILQIIINFIGVLGSELAFDALWYHLTFPKLYLLQHHIMHIPGGLLYYSDMPKLGEMLYVGALSFSNEILAKGIHFLFSLGVGVVVFLMTRKYISSSLALLAAVILFSNIVLDWEATTAYIDIIRTFFEVLALWGIIEFLQERRLKLLVLSGLMMGFAITTKLLAVGSLGIFIVLIFLYAKGSWTRKIKEVVLFVCISLLVPLPWFVFSYMHTGNPVYPFFTPIYPSHIGLDLLNPLKFVKEVGTVFINADDPISPLYFIFLPLVVLFFSSFSKPLKLVSVYSLVSIFVWYITPRTGGGRFMLPYLPAFSLLCVAVIPKISSQKVLSRYLLGVVFFISLIAIGYRGLANAKFLPVVLGKESKSEFLTKHLNFHFGDFYDTDGYFAKTIQPTDIVLLYGFHNLYYVDFPFIDSSWVDRNDTFTYVATQQVPLPKRFKNWQKVYSNPVTGVSLYHDKEGHI